MEANDFRLIHLVWGQKSSLVLSSMLGTEMGKKRALWSRRAKGWWDTVGIAVSRGWESWVGGFAWPTMGCVPWKSKDQTGTHGLGEWSLEFQGTKELETVTAFSSTLATLPIKYHYKHTELLINYEVFIEPFFVYNPSIRISGQLFRFVSANCRRNMFLFYSLAQPVFIFYSELFTNISHYAKGSVAGVCS